MNTGKRRRSQNQASGSKKFKKNKRLSAKDPRASRRKPLGKVIHIVGGEAIIHPPTKMPRSGNIAIHDGRVVGTVLHPIGRVDDPYIPVRLNQLGNKLGEGLIGADIEFAFRPKK